MGRTLLIVMVAIAIAGCSRLTPRDAGIGGGNPLTGQIVTTSAGKQLTVSDGLGFNCNGPVTVPAKQNSVTASVTCADGRSGIAVIELADGSTPKTATLKLGTGFEEIVVFKQSVSF